VFIDIVAAVRSGRGVYRQAGKIQSIKVTINGAIGDIKYPGQTFYLDAGVGLEVMTTVWQQLGIIGKNTDFEFRVVSISLPP